jgi:hypothetical protein
MSKETNIRTYERKQKSNKTLYLILVFLDDYYLIKSTYCEYAHTNYHDDDETLILLFFAFI